MGYRPQGVSGWYNLRESSGAVNLTTGVAAPVAETILGIAVVPANCMGKNGILELESLWTATNNANAKTVNAYFSATQDLNGTKYFTKAVANNAAGIFHTIIQNTNNVAAQNGGPIGGTYGLQGATALVTSAIDTLKDCFIVLSASLADGTDTITLEDFHLTLLPSN